MSVEKWTIDGSSRGDRPVTILVVDDEKIIRELCARALTEYRVVQAGNIDDALVLFEQESCDLVLSDVMMPGGNGLELLKKIKELDPSAVVVIMTGFAEKEVILNALKEGADDFINKPLNLLQLKTSIAKALARKRLKDELINLKRLDRLKSNFLSLISHKFRTPITSISLFLQNLQRGVHDTSDSAFADHVRMISDEAHALGRMVSDLLTFSRVMERGDELNREPCDLERLASELIGISREGQMKPGIEAELNGSGCAPVLLDRGKISFALQQVIDNAFKFSGEVGHVSVSIRSAAGRAYVVVRDSGIGIPPVEIPKVFEKFYQVDPDNTGQIRGFGLGLFYAREFVHQHGGTISIDSEPGLGTTVTVMLPLQ